MATSEAMIRAKATYYEQNKEKIAAKRNEYYKIYNAKRVETEEARNALNESHRNYRLIRKATTCEEAKP